MFHWFSWCFSVLNNIDYCLYHFFFFIFLALHLFWPSFANFLSWELLLLAWSFSYFLKFPCQRCVSCIPQILTRCTFIFSDKVAVGALSIPLWPAYISARSKGYEACVHFVIRKIKWKFSVTFVFCLLNHHGRCQVWHQGQRNGRESRWGKREQRACAGLGRRGRSGRTRQGRLAGLCVRWVKTSVSKTLSSTWEVLARWSDLDSDLGPQALRPECSPLESEMKDNAIFTNWQ